MKCRLNRDMKIMRPDPAFPDGIKPKGTLIEHRQAALLVRMGVAEPADEECRQRVVNMTPERMAAASHSYDRLEKGIAPDDFEAFDEGLMVGYNPDGSWIEGPNYEDAAWQERKRTSPLIIIEDE